ncbi:MAG: metallophosphoesterase [Clostridia bacterium]|nr:metallophosphoesterase [Clostridia bacterium]
MSSVFTAFMYKLLTMFISFTMLFGAGIPEPGTDDPIKVNENAEMSVVLWGDTQLSDYDAKRHQYSKNSAIDLSNADGNFDALVVAGDVTENGKGAEYQLLLDYLAVADNVDNHIFTVGNHDVRLRAYSQVVSTFNEFCASANTNFSEKAQYYAEGKLSYTYEVNGYTFIVLGTDKVVFEESYFSDEALTWFDAELAKATADGKPAFVVVHQPLKQTHQVWDSWNSPDNNAGTIGAQSDALQEIMEKYNNVFFITGHLHMGFSEEWSIHKTGKAEDKEGNVTLVNLPGIGPKNADGEYNAPGTGYIMEVYEDRVEFIARDFNLGKYVPEHNETVYFK